MLLIVLIISFSAYTIMLAIAVAGWRRQKPIVHTPTQAIIHVSVIVPYRNEATNLPALITSLKNQTYPKNVFELILVNDHSTDNSHSLAERLLASSEINYQLISLNSKAEGKKAAQKVAIQHAKGELLLFTDADCIVPENWIAAFVSVYARKNPKLIIGLVDYHPTMSLWSKIERLDFLSMMNLSAGLAGFGKPIICNGANMGVQKQVFQHQPNMQPETPSGDDVFLLHAIKSTFPKDICLLKAVEAIVLTKPANSFAAFLSQRIRWGSKSKRYTDFDTLMVAGVIMLLATVSCLTPIYYLTHRSLLYLYVTLIKGGIDVVFFAYFSSFWQNKKTLWLVPFINIVYPFYILSTGIITNLLPFTWKDRRYKTR